MTTRINGESATSIHVQLETIALAVCLLSALLAPTTQSMVLMIQQIVLQHLLASTRTLLVLPISSSTSAHRATTVLKAPLITRPGIIVQLSSVKRAPSEGRHRQPKLQIAPPVHLAITVPNSQWNPLAAQEATIVQSDKSSLYLVPLVLSALVSV